MNPQQNPTPSPFQPYAPPPNVGPAPMGGPQPNPFAAPGPMPGPAPFTAPNSIPNPGLMPDPVGSQPSFGSPQPGGAMTPQPPPNPFGPPPPQPMNGSAPMSPGGPLPPPPQPSQPAPPLPNNGPLPPPGQPQPPQPGSSQPGQPANQSTPSGNSPKQQIVEKLKSANNVMVTVSRNPNLDQLSAAIGLTLMMSKLGKHAATVFSGEIPSILEFLSPDKTIEKNTDSLRDFIISLDKSKADKLRYKVEDKVVKIFITPYRTSISERDLQFSQGDFNVDVVVALGVKDKEELDEAIISHGRILHDAVLTSLSVGQTPSTLGTFNWHEPSASSLCEMLVSISEAFKSGLLDGQMATAFLTGIVSETERFSNDKTSPKVMTMSAQLMAAGANQQLIAEKLEPPAPPPPPPPAPEPASFTPPAPAAPPLSPADPPQPPVSTSPEAVPMPAAPPPKEAPKNDNQSGLISIEHDLDTGGEAQNFSIQGNGGEVPDIHIDEQGNLQRIEEQAPPASAESSDPQPLAALETAHEVPAEDSKSTDEPPAGQTSEMSLPAPDSSSAPAGRGSQKVIEPLHHDDNKTADGFTSYMSTPPSRGGVLSAAELPQGEEPSTDPLSAGASPTPLLHRDAPPATPPGDDSLSNPVPSSDAPVMPPPPSDENVIDATHDPNPFTLPTPAPAPGTAMDFMPSTNEPAAPASAPANTDNNPASSDAPASPLQMPEPPLIKPTATPGDSPSPPPVPPPLTSFSS